MPLQPVVMALKRCAPATSGDKSAYGALRAGVLQVKMYIDTYGYALVERSGRTLLPEFRDFNPKHVWMESYPCDGSTLQKARVRGYQAGQDVEFQRSNGDWERGTVLFVYGDGHNVQVGYKPCGTECRKKVCVERLRRPLNPDLAATVKDRKEPLYVYCSAGESLVDAKTLLAARLGDSQSEET